MKTKTVTVHEGELLGPVDWSYDFCQHFNGYGANEARTQAACDKAVENLRALAANPAGYEATTDGGWPRVGWHPVIAVGMYDGWPYWKPTPSVMLAGVLGPEWHSFCSITDIAALKVTTTPERGAAV